MKNINIKKVFPWLVFILLPYFYSLTLIPQMHYLKHKNPRQTKFMKYYLKKVSRPGQNLFISYHFVPLQKIAPSLPRAVLYAEDCNFYRHHGIDWESIWLSFRENRRRGRIIHGGSTISMQLCKNLFLYPQKTLARKIIEIILTSRLEKILSKQRILELYLNVIEWGPGIYGVKNAAQYYFNKNAGDLSPTESALLAAIIMSPCSYHPEKQNPFFQRRQLRILAHLENTLSANIQELPDSWPVEELVSTTASPNVLETGNESFSTIILDTAVSENLELPRSPFGIEHRFEKLVSPDITQNIKD